jgi:hypothetical protein
MKMKLLFGILFVCGSVYAAEKPPVYLWLEPEWFEAVHGSFSYWTGFDATKPGGHWMIAGPGITAEFSQGGESEWNSMAVPAAETKAECSRDFVVPRAGKYKIWVRYVDHRDKTEPFTVEIQQGGKTAVTGELGVQPVVSRNDEYELYWGFAFGWGRVEGELAEGPAKLRLLVNKAGEAWRQLDAVLITDDASYVPYAREKPRFAYSDAFKLQPKDGASWRGSARDLPIGTTWKRTQLAGKDFTMWLQMGKDRGWEKDILNGNMYDGFFNHSVNADIAKQFREQFAGRKDIPIMSWPNMLPGFYLGIGVNLSPDTPLRKWLESTKTPFFIITNYAPDPGYTEATGPATYAALTGPLDGQFLGFINGESIGAPAGCGLVNLPKTINGKSRREHFETIAPQILKQQAEQWSKIFKTPVAESFWKKGISCLSVDAISLSHLFRQMGSEVVGFEVDASMPNVPMRIAFERGAARQFGGAWISYASANFGDSCNYFTQEPICPRGAKGWWHSKYSSTDGVPIEWYRKLYYLNYMSGASAVYWEQGLDNQYMVPGPGNHPVQLSPFGRTTFDFQNFVSRLPERGEPFTPVGVLLSYAHGYDGVSYACKMLDILPQSDADRELRELFDVLCYPVGTNTSLPITPDTQSMQSGIYGNIYDVLVDRPERTDAIFNYPVIWAAGDVELGGKWATVLEDYVKKGGTLVVNGAAARGKLPESLLGLKLNGKTQVAETWTPEGGAEQAATPFEVENAELTSAKPLALAGNKAPLMTRNSVGQGAVIVTLVPRMLGRDERAHPALAYLMNGLTDGLLPLEVRLANGDKLSGEAMYQVNRTKDGWLVTLFNNRGVDKTQTGIARVDRRAFVDLVIRSKSPVKSAKEWTEPRDLNIEKGSSGTEVKLRVQPGDIQVVGLVTR